MLETLFLMLKIFITGLVLFALAQVFQGKPVSTWLAWLTAVVVYVNLTVPPVKKA